MLNELELKAFYYVQWELWSCNSLILHFWEQNEKKIDNVTLQLLSLPNHFTCYLGVDGQSFLLFLVLHMFLVSHKHCYYKFQGHYFSSLIVINIYIFIQQIYFFPCWLVTLPCLWKWDTRVFDPFKSSSKSRQIK